MLYWDIYDVGTGGGVVLSNFHKVVSKKCFFAGHTVALLSVRVPLNAHVPTF